MSKPKAPAPPDYAAAAVAQGNANVDSAVASNYLNQANQVGPNGSLTYTYGNPININGKEVPQATATTTLSPDQQKLYDQNQVMSQGLNDAAISGIGYAANAAQHPVDVSKYAPVTSVPGQNLTGTIAPTSFGVAGGPAQQELQKSYDFSKVTAAPSTSDYTGARDQITNAMLERLQPQLTHDQNALETRNSNQGIFRGSEANNWDQQNLDKSQNDLKIAALLAGNQQQQADFANTMSVHNADVAQAQSAGNFTNQALNDQFGQAATSANITNQAQNQQFQQNAAATDAANKAASGNFAQGLASANLANSGNAQALQQAEYAQMAPVNMLNALRTGNQATIPTFGSATAGSNIAAAPVYQATADSYAAQMQAYQAQLQASGGFLGGLGALGGGIASMFKV